MYIPNPSHAVKTKQEAANDLAWASCKITLSQFNAISSLKGFIYKEQVTKTVVRVQVTEWLWLILQMDDYDKGTAFNIEYMTWENFKDIILDPNMRALDWHDLVENKDCIIGGVDYSIDHRWDGNPYGFDGNQFEKYKSHLELLSETVQFWPPIEQIKQAGKNWLTICSLQLMAQMKQTYFPQTVMLKDGTAIKESTILKRSNSDCSKHIIPPMVAAKYWTWKYLESCINDKEIWMLQEYVDTLPTIGEWRAFIIGGTILLVIHMQKQSNGKWFRTPIELFLTGTEIQEVMKRELYPTNAAEWRKCLINPQHGDMLVHEEGKAQFFNFVLDTWRGLVLQETQKCGKPSIAVFCWMDIGLMVTADGCPHYFMNEVEQSTTTSLWLACNINNTMGTMADTFAMVFRQWLHDMKNAYVVA
ncbi:hypothetical protein EDC04DRAFT_2902507 [Pisolithus marmoratus]|nr:hypothetical protein EDC04DRAFT_2902507 [Pisolithus marmoratus]